MKAAEDAILRPEQAAYLERMTPPRDALLTRMEARARERRYPISDPEVGVFLEITARARCPRFVVELGTNIGYGAILLARGAGPDARVVTAETSPDLCDEARGFIAEAGLASRIEVRRTTAIELLSSLTEPVDLAYVDCVKEEYPEYLRLLVPLLSERGMLVVDNVLWGGHVARAEIPDKERARTEALREFNRALLLDTRLRSVLLPLGDGVAYAVRC